MWRAPRASSGRRWGLALGLALLVALWYIDVFQTLQRTFLVPPTSSPLPPLPAPSPPVTSPPSATAPAPRDDGEVAELVRRVSLMTSSTDAQESKTVILVYASNSYVVPLMNWLAAVAVLERGVFDRVLVVCLDAPLRDYLLSLGYDCAPSYRTESETGRNATFSGQLNAQTVTKLWVKRSMHILAVLRSGVGVVLADTDAVLLRSPFQPGVLGDSDIVGGKGGFPYDAKWGAALCMGFVYLKSTPDVIRLTEDALRHTKRTNDDQVGFNRALEAWEDPARRPFDGVSVSPVSALTQSVILRNGLKFTFLSHNVVPRICNVVPREAWRTEVVAAHCHVRDGVPAPNNKNKGNQGTHLDAMIKYDLLRIPQNWRSVLSDRVVSKREPFRDVLKRLWRDFDE